MEQQSVLEAIYEDSENDFLDSDIEDGGEINGGIDDDDVEEGEIARSSIFDTGNYLDIAIKDAKYIAQQTRLHNAAKEHKKRHRRRRKGKTGTIDDVAKFISQTSARLREPKVFLVQAAVNKLGVQAVRDLVKEVGAIERHGGQVTADGKRRRTPGGVLWNILRSRVQPDVYKDIMAKGKEVEKELRRGNLKRHHMDIDEQRELKRRKIDVQSSCPILPAAQVKKTGRTPWPTGSHGLKSVESLSNTSVDPDALQNSSHSQLAWVEGLKCGKVASGTDDVKLQEVCLRMKPASLAERIRMPIHYSDVAEESHQQNNFSDFNNSVTG